MSASELASEKSDGLDKNKAESPDNRGILGIGNGD